MSPTNGSTARRSPNFTGAAFRWFRRPSSYWHRLLDFMELYWEVLFVALLNFRFTPLRAP
jgi:hypothetical protein